MSEQIKIQKTIYSLQSFNNTVNTSFSQLATSLSNEKAVQPDMTVSQFFNEYDVLFYDIPPSGSDESHLALATRSLDYLGISLEDLQNEITELREENINLKNQILLTSQINPGTLV
jgi:hypothetical protein